MLKRNRSLLWFFIVLLELIILHSVLVEDYHAVFYLFFLFLLDHLLGSLVVLYPSDV